MIRTWRWQAALVATLAILPIGFLIAVGFYHLWATGWSFITYWPMGLCWLLAYFLAWYFTRQREKPPETPVEVPLYWTERDREAWAIVETHIAAMPPMPKDALADLNRYAAPAQELALAVAKVYQPGANDPFAHLTMPEILTCGELITHDLTKLVREGVPGSHLLTLGDIKRLWEVTDRAMAWYPRVRNVYWAASLVFNPLKTISQMAFSQALLGPTQSGVQSNVVQWFQTVYLREVGRYLIELNSGRLRVGAARYLELTASAQAPEQPGLPTAPTTVVTPVTVALVGPVKAGKSSLVNALLGEQLAATDVLPLTAGRTRYALRREGIPPLTLIDSAGFGLEGATEADVSTALEAAQEADLLLLVVPARSAARAPEVEFLNRLHAAMKATPRLKLPPIVVVLSHVDLLTPAMEWSPPYDPETGSRPKEVSMREALAAATEVFGEAVEATVPVCTAPNRVWGVAEELMPRVLPLLGEARGVAVLRNLHAEADAGQAKRVWQQLQTAGKLSAHLIRDWLKRKG
ncbi:MAG: GTPase family protein [Fimbriiglobus sp.]